MGEDGKYLTRAKFATEVRHALKEAGYPEESVQLTVSVLGLQQKQEDVESRLTYKNARAMGELSLHKIRKNTPQKKTLCEVAKKLMAG